MPVTDSTVTGSKKSVDWRAWLALIWAGWFGLLYARMVLQERAPRALHAIERAAEPLRTWCK
jgi:hypothetical protein